MQYAQMLVREQRKASAVKAAATARGTKAADIAAEDIITDSSKKCAEQLETQCSCI